MIHLNPFLKLARKLLSMGVILNEEDDQWDERGGTLSRVCGRREHSVRALFQFHVN
jgi:hypothetical protein